MLVLIPIARKTHHFFRDSKIANAPLPAHPAAMSHNHHVPTHVAIPPRTIPAASAPSPHTSRIRAPWASILHCIAALHFHNSPNPNHLPPHRNRPT